MCNIIDDIVKNIITPNPEYEFNIIFCVWDVILDQLNNVEKWTSINIDNLTSIYSPKKYSILNYFESMQFSSKVFR